MLARNRAMTSRIPPFIALAMVLLAGTASAQYARPGAIQKSGPHEAAAAGVTGPPGSAQGPQLTRPVPGTITPQAPFCFEPIDQRDAALTNALAANGLLCPTVAKAGAPARIRSTPAGELVGEATGAATVFHRSR